MFKGVVTDIFFDLDHTLWDFDRNSALTFERILKDHDITIDITHFLKVYVPVNLAYWKLYREDKIDQDTLRFSRLHDSFTSLGHTLPKEMISSLAKDYIAHLTGFNHLFPFAIDILEYLKPDYRLHIITNGFKETQEKKLRNSGILTYFDKVVNSEMAGVKKPNPLIFELALELAGTTPARALMIGDSLEADILGARAVGLHTLHFNAHGESTNDHGQMITDLSEIKTYL